jgi:hypothetical protein
MLVLATAGWSEAVQEKEAGNDDQDTANTDSVEDSLRVNQ